MNASSSDLCVSFLAAQTFTWRQRGLGARRSALLVLLKRDSQKTHTRDVHTQTQSKCKKSIRSRCMCVCVCVTEGVRQAERTWGGRATRRRRRGSAEVVSGIESRGGRCWFINASRLLNGGFWLSENPRPSPVSVKTSRLLNNRPTLSFSLGTAEALTSWRG